MCVQKGSTSRLIRLGSYISSLLWAGQSGDPILVRARFSHPSRPVLGPTQFPIQEVLRVFRGGKQPGHGIDHPPPYSAKVKKSMAVPLLSLLAFMAFSRVTSTFTFYLIFLTTDYAEVPGTL